MYTCIHLQQQYYCAWFEFALQRTNGVLTAKQHSLLRSNLCEFLCVHSTLGSRAYKVFNNGIFDKAMAMLSVLASSPVGMSWFLTFPVSFRLAYGKFREICLCFAKYIFNWNFHSERCIGIGTDIV